jgi:hypothetical protein
MQRIVFRNLPGIAEIEQEYLLYIDDRLMKPEREELERRLDEKSIDLFGITEEETHYLSVLKAARTTEEWERHFEFIYEPHEEEDDFWRFFDIDVTDGEGMQLACMYAFGRQLVCALKRLHPSAAVNFRQGEGTNESLEAAAEAWGKRLLIRKS